VKAPPVPHAAKLGLDSRSELGRYTLEHKLIEGK